MTALTLIVGGELTASGRPLSSRRVQNRPPTATRLDMNLFVELDESGEWMVGGVPSAWKRPELMRLFSAGIPPAARSILDEIARRPEGYPFDKLHGTLEMTRLAVAASLDAAADAARAFPDKPALVRRDYQTRAYCMPLEVAAFLVPCPHPQDGQAD